MRRGSHIRRRQALVLISVGALGGFLVCELAVRIATDSLFVFGGKEAEGFAIVDPLVGRLPRPGGRMRFPEGFSVTIGEHGTRSNGNPPPAAGRPLLLAVGDSFAFGDDVNDDESWPAALERLLGSRVVNAGVPGFGLDQAVLRAEQLFPVYRPDIVVVGVIPHDVTRCGMSYWSGFPKPYFVPEGSGLRLHPAPRASPRSRFKRALAASAALDLLFPRFLHWEGPESLRAHDREEEVACRLMERLARLGGAHPARIVVLLHPQAPQSEPEHPAIARRLAECAEARSLRALNLFPVFDALSPADRASLFRGHLSAEGNRLIAARLAAFLRESSALPAEGSRAALDRGPTSCSPVRASRALARRSPQAVNRDKATSRRSSRPCAKMVRQWQAESRSPRPRSA